MTQPRPDDAMAREANVFARYLLDVDCPAELADRYTAAIRRLTPNSQLPAPGVRVANFAVRRSWSLPYIAAAAPFFGSGALLRWKLTVMSAVLETTPRFAHEFLPRDLSLGRLVWTLASTALIAALRAIVGVPLLLVARVSR